MAPGIGRAIALALSRAGFSIVVNDLPGSDDLSGHLRNRRAANPITLDISQVEQHHQSVNEVWNALGGIDCLFNNAGVSDGVRDDLLKTPAQSRKRPEASKSDVDVACEALLA